MPNLYTISLVNEQSSETLTEADKMSVAYHNIFDYPLSFSDLNKWKLNDNLIISSSPTIISKNNYYFVEGKENSIYKRQLHKRISKRKLAIATKAGNILSFIPTVKMVGITGSLAMENSNEESDIDLMIVTNGGTLWSTRILVYLSFAICHLPFRKPNDRNQKDKLCLNMWLDENDLTWGKKDRNIYTAHEVAQVVPLVNKNKTYEKFLSDNKWILKFWPSAVRIKRNKDRGMNQDSSFLSLFLVPLERVCYWIQKKYMEKKVTRELVTPTRALFHPQDWGKIVLSRLSA